MKNLFTIFKSLPKPDQAAMFAKLKAKYGQATLNDEAKTVVFYEGDEIAVDTALFVETAEGELIAAPEGEHTLEDGRVLTVSIDGIVTAITDPNDGSESEEMVSAEAAVEMARQMVELQLSVDTVTAQLTMAQAEVQRLKKENTALSKAMKSPQKHQVTEHQTTKTTDEKFSQIKNPILKKLLNVTEK